MSNLREKLARGAFWTIFFRISTRTIGLISTVILARLLLPSDFGLVALAAASIALLNTVTEFGPEAYLISTASPSKADYDTAWTLQVIRGTIIAILVYCFANSLSVFFEEPRLADVLSLLCVGIFLQGFVNIGVVNFRKHLNFRGDFIFLIVPRLCGFLVTLVLAVILRNYWAMIYGMVVTQACALFYSYYIEPTRSTFTLRNTRRVFNFSKWIFSNNVLQVLSHKFDTFLVGKQADSGQLGLYSLSYEIATLATTEIAAPIRRAMLPGYSKIANQHKELVSLYLDVFALTVFLTLPVAAGIGLTADLIVTVFLGENWLLMTPLLTVMAICGALQAIGAGASPLFLACGKPKLIVLANFGAMLLQVPLMIWAMAEFGLVGVAWALVATWAWRQTIIFYLVFRVIGTKFVDHFLLIWRTLASTAITAGVVFILRENMTLDWLIQNPILELTISLLLGVATLGTSYYGLWLTSANRDAIEHRTATWILKLIRNRE